MAKLPTEKGKKFDSSQHGDMGFNPLPAGEYPVMITKSAVKETKYKTGFRILLTLTVLKGEQKGKTAFISINYLNVNPIAQEIGQREVASLTRAIWGHDFDWDNETENLHGKPFQIDLGVEPATDQWPAKNIVKKYSSLSGAALPEDLGNHDPTGFDSSSDTLPNDQFDESDGPSPGWDSENEEEDEFPL